MWCNNRLFVTVGLLTISALAPISVSAQAHSNLSAAELALKNIELAPGLKIDLFASDPHLYNPVAFSIDEKGRFFISESHRYKTSIFDIWAATQAWKDADASFRTVEDRAGFLAKEYGDKIDVLSAESEIIRLVEDRNGDGQADHSEIFAEGFDKPTSGTAAGVLARHGQLWLTSIPDLWHFSYDENGTAAERELLHTGYGVHIGVSGHDLHGLIMGPDGKIYFTVGDRGANVVNKELERVQSIDGGAVFRCDPDGSNLEIFATGLRNPQEIAFDKFGNLWAHDNDTGGADKSRMMYVVEDGEYGWRYSYQFMSGFGPWVQEEVWKGGIDDILPHAGYGAQGPAGLAYYPGTGLPERYENHFIACDFPNGAISITSEPSGASYTMTQRERFVWNAGLTDVAFGPDGELYASDWGRSYQMPDAGRIYRISDPEQANNPAKAELKELLSTGMKDRSTDELTQLLSHRDLRVRTEAQFQLIELGETDASAKPEIAKALHQVALESDNLLARIHAIWALQKIAVPETVETIAKLLTDSDFEVRAQAAKFAGETGWQKLAPALTDLLQDENARVRFFAARSLGKLAQKSPALHTTALADSLLQLIRENDDEDAYITHAGMMALLDIGDITIIERAAKDESAAVRRIALVSLRRLNDPRVADFLRDPDPRIRYEAARAINDAPVNAAMPELAARLADSDCDENVLSRAINANFRVGEPANAVTLATFAAREDAPEKFRVEAIRALGDWETPAGRDRIIGLWRPLKPRDSTPARSALAQISESVLEKAPESVRVALVESAATLHATEIGGQLFAALEKPQTTIALRQAIPAALVKLGFPQLQEMMQIVLADKDLSVRRAGIDLLDQVEVKNTSALLANLLATESDIRLSQSAIATLGRIQEPEADTVIADILDKLIAGEIRPELQLEILEAAGKRSSAAVKERLAQYAKTLTPGDALAPYRSTLVGGHGTIGKKIFDERDSVGCLRCHAVDGKGGKVGPDLAGIGKEESREYLLEAIIEPNKTFAKGFERLVLELKNGETAAGLVENETDDAITLLTPESRTIAKTEIETRHQAISAMPPGLEKLLTPRELRDLMEYLAQLK